MSETVVILRTSVPIPMRSLELNPDTSLTDMKVETPVTTSVSISFKSSTDLLKTLIVTNPSMFENCWSEIEETYIFSLFKRLCGSLFLTVTLLAATLKLILVIWSSITENPLTSFPLIWETTILGSQHLHHSMMKQLLYHLLDNHFLERILKLILFQKNLFYLLWFLVWSLKKLYQLDHRMNYF